VEFVDYLLRLHDGRSRRADITLAHSRPVVRACACSPSHSWLYPRPVRMVVVQTGIEHDGRTACPFALAVQTPAAHIYLGAGAQVLHGVRPSTTGDEARDPDKREQRLERASDSNGPLPRDAPCLGGISRSGHAGYDSPMRTNLSRTTTGRPTTSTLTTTEAAILGLVAEGELSGYDLQRRVERTVGYFWKPARSQIYAVLPRLVTRGLAVGRRVRQDTRPDKHLYRITREGLVALREWLELAPLEPDAERILLIKLFFAEHGDPEVMRGFVREFRAKAELLARDLAEIEANADRDGDRFHGMTRAYGLAVTAAIVAWAHSVEEELA
jgi:PadR family transcriptional regulator AphA